MIKLFCSVTFATALMGLVACEPTSTSSPTVKGTNATQTPSTKTESNDTVPANDPIDTPTTPTVSKTNEATQTPAPTTESTETATEASEASESPIVTTESTGNVTGEGTGTVSEYAPGEFVTLKTETGEPLRCKFGEIVTYVTSDGKVIDASRIRRDSKVRLLYHKDGDDMVVDKVIVTE